MMHFNLRASLPRWTAMVLWLLLGFSVGAWVLRVEGVADAAVGAPPPSEPPAEPDSLLVARALGAVASSHQAVAGGSNTINLSRFVLLGVIDRGQGLGTGLIAVDGQSAKPFVTGSVVADGVVITRVARNSAWLAQETAIKDDVELKLLANDSSRVMPMRSNFSPGALMPEPNKPFSGPVTVPTSAALVGKSNVGGTSQ